MANNSVNGLLSQDELLIGKLNKEVKKNTYTGGTTATATVIVDNVNNVITVNSKGDVSEIEERIDELEETVATMDKNKSAGLYYDALSQLAEEPLWYMCYDINNPATTLLKDASGKYVGYDLGAGGGGSSIDVNLTQLSWPTSAAYGGECIINTRWNATREEKAVTGTGTATLTVNGVVAETKYNVEQGTVSFDVGPYLEANIENEVIVLITFRTAIGQTNNNIKALVLTITSTFDGLKPYTGDISYNYIPNGSVTKTVHFYVDDVEVGTQVVTTSGDQQTYIIKNLGHKNYKFRVYFTCTIGSDEIKSNELNYDLIHYVDGETDPIIASTFDDLEQTQYVAFDIPYRVYTPNYSTSNVLLQVVQDEEVIYSRTVTVDQSEQIWEYQPDAAGSIDCTITSGVTSTTFRVFVNESEIPVEPVTQNLVLALTATGRSNSEQPEERIKWTDSAQGLECTLSNFNFTSDGWLKDDEGDTALRITGDARVTIPYYLFGVDFKPLGKTIEIEFSTSEVRNYETPILSCFQGDKGLYLTSQLAIIKSDLSTLQSQYKEDDHIRVSFVIEKSVETRLVLMYINGIMSGCLQYDATDDFKQREPVYITLGTNDATMNVYNIRVYDNNLTRKQVVNNWIADTQSGALRAARYLRNDNYDDAGKIVISKLPDDLPYLTATITKLPEYKGDKQVADLIEYVDPTNDDQSFDATKAQMNVQGTSSQYYFRKNFKISYKGGFTHGGETKATYPIIPGAIEEKEFTYKADVASSEGANNVELVKYYQDTKTWKTPAEKLNSKVRVGIDGYPIVMFHSNDSLGTYFYGKMNFNNDKGNEATFGFEDGDESWEITNNNTEQVVFHDPDLSAWSDSFEARYPDDGEEAESRIDEHFKPMFEWVCSTYRKPTDTEEVKAQKLAKFKAELANWFDVDSTLFYYLFTELFLLVDSRAKNAFPTYMYSRVEGDGGDRWFWFPYDMDTAIGINNEGALVFNYNLEDTDTVEGAKVFNGQDSTMWCNVRDAFKSELAAMYQTLRSGTETTEAWSYANIEKRFEDHQDKWSETIFNEDAYSKYLTPLIESGDKSYLEMLQGSKEEQRKWWLYNRFKYIDSKYNAGDALNDYVNLRAYNTADITVTPYADIYASVRYGNTDVVQTRAERGQSYTLKNPLSAMNDTECAIYSASQLSSIGDLAPLQVGYFDSHMATKLQSIKLGEGGNYINPNLKSLSVGSNKMLASIDVRNCSNLVQPVDLSGCTNIETVLFDGTAVTAVTLPNGGILKKLHLPNTIKSLIIRNQKLLSELEIEDGSNAEKLWLENIPSTALDVHSFINSMTNGSLVRVIGFNYDAASSDDIKAFYDKLDLMHGLNAQGEQVDKAQIQGTINVNEISYADYIALKARYQEIEINALKIWCVVRFLNEGVLYESQSILQGHDATKPAVDPEKEATVEHTYTFEGWDKPLTNIQEDTDINAVYSEHVRIYDVTFDYQTDKIPTLVKKVAYGSKVERPEDPVLPGSDFGGWFNEKECLTEFNFDNPIITATFVYAKWVDKEHPNVVISATKHNTFHYTLTDNVGIIAYAITRSAEEPTEWITVEPTAKYEGDQVIDNTVAPYYVWAKDAYPYVSSSYITIFGVTQEVSTGATLEVKSNGEDIGSTVVNTTVLDVKANCIEHYESPKLFINDEEQETTEISFTIVEDIVIKATANPIVYTVDFNMMGKGEQEPSQSIVYNHLVTKPKDQFASGYIISGWYKEPGYATAWNFDTDKVDQNITLYAKWEVYVEPTIISINVTDEHVGVEQKMGITCNESSAIEIDWGDGTAREVQTGSGSLTCKHTYTTAIGESQIKIYNPTGASYYFTGTGSREFAIDCAYKIQFSFSISLIKSSSFYNAGISEIITTKYLRKIDSYGLGNCNSLTKISLFEGLESIGSNAFRNTSITEIDIPDSVTSIGESAFYDCKNLQTAKLPKGLTQINSATFNSCTSLVNITWPEELLSIGQQAFYRCSKLVNVVFPEKLQTISRQCFWYCTSLASVSLPTTLQTIDYGAFSACSSLASINIPDSVTYIGDQAFNSCVSLPSIDIPISVTYIGISAFAACKKLARAILRNPNLEMGQYVFSECLLIKSAGPIGSGCNIEFAWVDKIPDNAFSTGFQQGYITYIEFPNTITEIGSNAFKQQGFTSITLPPALEKIGASAFYRTSLTTVNIPYTVTDMGADAFQYVPLGSVYMHFLSSETKIEVVTDAWFNNAGTGAETIHASKLLTPELAITRFGTYWNYYNESTPLTVVFDQD